MDDVCDVHECDYIAGRHKNMSGTNKPISNFISAHSFCILIECLKHICWIPLHATTVSVFYTWLVIHPGMNFAVSVATG